MKIHVTETGELIQYTVVEREGLSDESLRAMFYEPKDGIWSKGIPRERLMFPQEPALLEGNYNACIEYELHQERRTRADLEAALAWVADECARRGIRWWLAGSGALFARGLDVTPHDLDVMTWKSEIEAIRELVAPHIVEPFHHVTGWVVKGFGVANVHHTRLDFAFEPEDWVDGQGPVDFGPFAVEHLETVDWQGRKIRVPPVELHIAPNEARGRHERVARIRAYLAERRA
jgi:hypothetical protein